MSKEGFNRRDALKLAGGSFAAVTTSNLAVAGGGDAVRINVGYSAADGRRAALDATSEVVREFAFDALTVVVPEPAVGALAQRPGVRYVERDGEYRTLGQTTPWGVSRIDADEVHCSCGSGVDVAIIDSGVDGDHPDLTGNVCTGATWVGSSWDDDNGHGTSVAGVVGAAEDGQGIRGVAPCACLRPLKVLDRSGSGLWSDVAAAIEYTAEQNWEIANLSLGGGHSSVVQDAVQYAYNRGVLLVAAAGDDYGGPVSYPAAYPECIAVSAIDRYDNVASFSATGPEIELAAPGENIYTTTSGGEYGSYSGTSLAAPHVSGTGALAMALGYTNAETRSRLRDSAEDLGLSADGQGYGLVDARGAVDC